MDDPLKPTVVPDRSQHEITESRRDNRKKMLKGVVGSRRKPLRLTYPEPSEQEVMLQIKYEDGYSKGYEKAKQQGESKGKWKYLLFGIAIGYLVTFVIAWLS
jgi:flagellar biosynthesis/type III secretory pathway protein FliH